MVEDPDPIELVEQLRERAEASERRAAQDLAAYHKAVAAAVEVLGAEEVRRRLDWSRARVYQVVAKAKRSIPPSPFDRGE